MLNIIHYDELTWPEVVDLPRNIPFILPLGNGYTFDDIGQMIEAKTICLLPALPYGWQGSAAPVTETMLQRVVNAIFDGLVEQGFTQFFVIHSGSEKLANDPIKQISLPRTSAADPQPVAATQQRVILIPCGHTEQHGYHLPLSTDTVIIGAIASGTVAGNSRSSRDAAHTTLRREYVPRLVCGNTQSGGSGVRGFSTGSDRWLSRARG